jgi:hypothetical protein
LTGLFVLSTLLVLILWDLAANTHFGERDFMAYWSSAYLFQKGENPYSNELMTAVQRSEVQSTLDVTIMSWNPPFLFVFLLPLAWMSFTVAKFAWLLVNIALVVTASLMLTQVYLPAASPQTKLVFLAFALTFPGVLAGFYMGQVTFLVFWGLTACTWLIRQQRWFWAGTVLILTATKPHLTILSVLYLLVYMAKHRRWQGWIGLAFAGLTCLMVLIFFRPGILVDFQGATVVASVPWATATIGGLVGYLGISEMMRYLILLFLPLPLLLANASNRFPPEFSVALLTLITVPTTFFGWSYDQTILLIPIAQVFGWLAHSKYRLAVSLCMAGAVVINYYQRLLVINDTFYVWVPLFWWVIFALLWRTTPTSDTKHAYSGLSSLHNHRYR